MVQKPFAKLALFGLMSLVLGATGVLAQNSSCGLRIDVKRDDNDAFVSGAAAIAVNTDTKQVYRSVLRKGMPFFASLNEGEYQITVTKVGFKKSAYSYVVTCVEMENGVIAASVPMWQGSSKETISVDEAERKDIPFGLSISPGQTGGEGAPVSSNSSKTINGGVINGKATKLVKPAYPAAARAAQAAGAVNVQVTFNEEGDVISATAVSGHPLLREAAVEAARASKFAPTRLAGQLVKVTGVIVYNFVP